MTGKTKEMPALNNPRWERFAQLIVEGLMNGDRKAYSQGRAYIAAGYEAKDAGKRGGSAEAAASRLLNRVKPTFAQALFAALSSPEGYSQGRAYRAAGYLAKPGASADSAASITLRKFKGIIERVRELQAEANKRAQPKIDLSRERIGRNLDEASRIAKEQRNPSAIVSSEL